MKKIGQMNIVEFTAKFTLAGIVISLISLIPLAGFIGGCKIKEKIDELRTAKEDDE